MPNFDVRSEAVPHRPGNRPQCGMNLVEQHWSRKTTNTLPATFGGDIASAAVSLKEWATLESGSPRWGINE